MVAVISLPYSSTCFDYLLLIGDQSSITFDSEMRQGYLFEDRNFSKSKRYFWALQSLRLFTEHLEGTLRSIPNLFLSIRLADSSLDDYETVKCVLEKYEKQFGELRDRIERKRQGIESLRDGVCQLTRINSLTEKLTESCSAIFSLVCSRGQTRLGAK